MPKAIQNLFTNQALAASAIAWDQASSFTKTISANTTLTFSGAVVGQTILVRLTNTGAFTVTWPVIRWVGGVAPVMTTGASSDVYTIFYDGTNYYGSAVQGLT